MADSSTAPIAGVPHVSKAATAPKARTNQLNIRVSPLKRMIAAAPKIKGDKPSTTGNF